MTDQTAQPRDPGLDTDPDLRARKRHIAGLTAEANRKPDPYADHGAYGQDSLRATRARQELGGVIAECKRYEATAKAERQLIGIARRALAVDDDAHAALVARITNGRTATTLGCSESDRQAILDHYRGCGFRDTMNRHRTERQPSDSALGRSGMLRKVRAMLAEQNLPWKYAEAILRRQRGLQPGTRCPPELTTPDQLRALIAALSRRARRNSAKQEPAA